MDIKGAVALVSGGASGLGAATARRLVAAGAKVVLADLNEERGAALAQELGGAARFVRTDVTSGDSVQAAVAAARELGTLRVAVSCAGIGWATRTLAKDGTPHDFESFKTTIHVNLLGTFNVLRLAAAAIAQAEPGADNERGVIINTASVAAYDGQTGQLAYAASKGGVVAMTLPAARDLSPAGIRVVTIAPGIFDTPMMATLSEPARASLGAQVPHPKRLGDPREYGALVLHIVENGYLNGEVIRLDGSIRMAAK